MGAIGVMIDVALFSDLLKRFWEEKIEKQQVDYNKKTLFLFQGFTAPRVSLNAIEHEVKHKYGDDIQVISFKLGYFGRINVQKIDLTVRFLAEKIRKFTRISECIFCGHSMGGLIAVQLAEIFPQIRRVITLSSPLKGAPLARLGQKIGLDKICPCITQMIPGCEFLNQMDKVVGRLVKARKLFTLYGDSDMIVPKWSAVIPNTFHKIFKDYGHARITEGKEALRLICELV